MSVLTDDFGKLVTFDPASLAVTAREGKHREFKQDFAKDQFSEYTRTLAAFANTGGGVLIFGITNKPRLVIGINAADFPDEAQWADRLREDFDPEIAFETHRYEVAGKAVMAVEADEARRKPVVCRKSRTRKLTGTDGKAKDTEVLREGSIYYRYSGVTRLIAYNELTAMLEERETSKIKSLMETLKVIGQVGVQNVGVVDLTGSRESEAVQNIYVSRETAKALNFIEKGKFVSPKEEGTPAYTVTGKVMLNQVIRAPMDEEDKNLPTEAAEQLKPTLTAVYGGLVKSIAPGLVTKMLKHLKLLQNERYTVEEKKLRRRYITRLGIEAVRKFITSSPLDAIRCFGSKAAIAAYEASLKPAGPPATAA